MLEQRVRLPQLSTLRWRVDVTISNRWLTGPIMTGSYIVQVNLASLPGSSAPEREIELVHAEKAWYFSHVSTAKGRAEVTL